MIKVEEIKQGYFIAEVWNTALEDQEKRVIVPREKLWASELGGATIDLYLKLKGTELSNPPNARSLRKFEAGNIFEWIVSLVLKRAGILVESQKWAQFQYDGLLPVSGKADFIAGSAPDFGEGEKFIQFLSRAEVPNVFLRCFERVLKHIEQKYPKGMENMPVEVKSVSSFAMDLMEKTKKPTKRHRMQLFHYLKSMGFSKGVLVYICRDDLRMMEFVIEVTNAEVEKDYKGAIEAISKYYYANEMPPKEKYILFEDGKFTKNFNISWSGYMTLIYGFKEPRDYDEPYGKKATNWNRVLKRIKDGAKMTEKNEEVIKEIKAEHDLDAIIKEFATDGIEEEEVLAE